VTLLVVGSVALDSVETPFGSANDVVGGSATFFSSSACHFTRVQLVGVVGSDYPMQKLEALAACGVELSGLERVRGESFRWRGRYGHDLNSAETLETRLGVFAEFRPKIPAAFRQAPYVFLANIDPRLQLAVLDQVESPKFVGCDTMNFWIASRRGELLDVLRRVDLVTLNDGEARQLSEQVNLVQAARWILDRGPRYVVIKKGEHGAFLFSGRDKGATRLSSPDARVRIFFAPAYPLEQVFDPTGAGDAFAGGFMGHVARTDDLSDRNLRRAVVIGSAMGSFAVEAFSNERLLAVTADEIVARVREFYELVTFEHER
jgi:sugar/nucleoside kinase (ribokinase family)